MHEKCSTDMARYKYNGLHRKPDLRRSGHLAKGTKGVCIELELDESQILFSQFEMWNWVLNGNFVPYGNDDCVELERRRSQNALPFSEVKASWTLFLIYHSVPWISGDPWRGGGYRFAFQVSITIRLETSVFLSPGNTRKRSKMI